ncbi:nicotinate-nucleotide--dimethylbenzimidazole phosphoribosyltransferase [Desulfobacula toluolica]|uniref:Nicotinate-nucleotide--dimethylbenzimidazole phosphoribosyltransferase n=1 Tax=Desulfobacula toluolica (strain DSM 7467 / Tol2) TaxID=651182 RepID=K0N3K4_DESTT|nr:nicotinate-nucleotide--dimethylbenzimidazole phosphoribosyltransferase [Desulfobacula toluolica]CCK78704.1 CobT: predicted nicotinate-nucleotide--dimethylbenzimidazole phosphoribosyltransferase [Desulfobacula toluolica Tol2]
MKMVLTGLGKLEIDPAEQLTPPPEKGYVQTRVLCCAICRTDAKMWEQGHRDLVLPRVLGHEIVVADQTGQRFVVWPGKSCGTCTFCQTGRENLCQEMKITGFHTDGGFADHAVLPKDSLIPIPDDLAFHAACFAEPVGCVINAFEKLSVRQNDRILIYGSGTMGLITALYARHLGLVPQVLEKNETKIAHIAPFVAATGIACNKDTHESEFELVINTCGDFIAFCQGIAKVGKAGQICFFSGISKNEHIETNLLNLIHYKEAVVSGVYGMTRAHMKKAVPFMQAHEKELNLLIEAIVAPQKAPDLMAEVLSGKHLKYILDFSLASNSPTIKTPQKSHTPDLRLNELAPQSLCKKVIEQITPLPNHLLAAATAKIDEKTKPLGALGRIEDLAIQMSLIQDSLNPEIRRKNLFVFAGDHGICEEGVSAYPSEVTAQMVDNFLNGGAAINVLCRHHSIEMKVVDMGVIREFTPHPGLIIKKVANGTKNFAIENAMTRQQVIHALENGMTTFLDAYEQNPIDIVGVGEMGIGNTTPASAIICVITGLSPAQATGRGTGIDDKGLAHKTEVIERVLAFHTIDPSNGFEILQKIGGFEIAGIAGAILAAASKKTAVVLDGVISTAAGLVAYAINPSIRGYLISGHKSAEQSQKAALSHMDLVPLIDFNMRLGEGTGAAIAIDMAETACKIMTQMASFDEAQIARSSIK